MLLNQSDLDTLTKRLIGELLTCARCGNLGDMGAIGDSLKSDGVLISGRDEMRYGKRVTLSFHFLCADDGKCEERYQGLEAQLLLLEVS